MHYTGLASASLRLTGYVRGSIVATIMGTVIHTTTLIQEVLRSQVQQTGPRMHQHPENREVQNRTEILLDVNHTVSSLSYYL